MNLLIQNGCTALYLASLKGHVAVVKQLLMENPDVNICNKVAIIFSLCCSLVKTAIVSPASIVV